MDTTRSGSNAGNWKSEEDFYLARLAISMGLVGQQTVEAALVVQGQAFSSGQPVSLGQVLMREGQLGPEALVRLKHEMMRCYHTCPGCGVGGYLAPGPRDRFEQCGRCGTSVPVPAAGSTVSQSWMAKREQAMHATGFRGGADPLARSGVLGPSLFANYILEDQLAKGGMGAIYRVRHTETQQVYALKVLLAAEKATERQVHRFQREAKAQMELGDHPHIVKIHEAGEWEGILYFSMDLIDGTDLGKAYTALRIDERVTMLAKVARAVQHAHDRGYIHRDLKPANILLDKDNEPLITDFGLAKNIGGNTMLTQEGSVMGTPFYMAPEQATGDVESMGPCSDIYSLGVLLYEQVTGEVPFRAETQVELYRMILERTPASFAEHGVSEPRLEQICFKAMEKDPELRYASAEEFAADLERVNRGEAPQISTVTSVERLSRTVERNKRSIGFVVGMLAAGLVVLVGAAVVFKLARDHVVASRALVALEGDAKLAAQNLESAARQATPHLKTVAALDDAIAAAQTLLAKEVPEEPVSFPSLRASLRKGLIARARVGLAQGTGRGGADALAAVDAAEGLGPAGEELVILAELRTRSLWRTGNVAAASRALAAFREAAPNDARLAWLLAVAARRAGNPKEALAHLERAGASDPVVRLERARVLGQLGQAKAAATELRHSLQGGRAAIARRTWLRILIEEGRTREAADLAVTALRATAHDAEVAAWAGALLMSQGRDHEAALALEAAARGTVAGGRELWLRARARLGHDVRNEADGTLLGCDLSAAAGEPKPYSAPAADDGLALRCARLRWASRAGTVDLGNLPAAVFAELPADCPPQPALARAARDLAWALRRAGQAKQAQRAVAAALRGLPDDLDARLLAARLDPKAAPAAARAFEREAGALQGALGRGLLIARQLSWRAKVLGKAKAKTLRSEARQLLRARLAGSPSLWIVERALAELLGSTPPSAPEDEPVDWAVLVPPLPKLRPEMITPAQRQAAVKLINAGMRRPKGQEKQAREEVLAGLKEDPYSALGRWELLQIDQDYYGARPWVLLQYMRYLQLRPGWAFACHLMFKREWADAILSFDVTPQRSHTAWAKDPKTANDPVHLASSVLDRYNGLLYPKTGRRGVEWSKDTPANILADLGSVVRLDPRSAWLLSVRAHLLALQDRPKLARRDLDLATALIGTNNTHHQLKEWSFGAFDLFYRAWVLAYHDPEQAIATLLKIDPKAPMTKKPRILINEWLAKGPGLEALRKQAPFKRFVRAFKAVKQQ